jgi:ATP-dependent exoDNAse (exonuclease V) beta subunit
MSASLQSMMIRASAGSGKTWQLSNRFLALMALGVAPEKIIALTFTRKAAGEFTGRIMTRLAEGAESARGARKLAGEISVVIHGNDEIPAMVKGDLANAPEMDQAFFQTLLQKLVVSLDQLALSTLDSYFVRIVRNFALELGLSGFDLMEDDAISSERLSVMATIFSNEHTRKNERLAFLDAFKQATWGEEENRLCKTLEEFVKNHQNRWLIAPEITTWGGENRLWPDGCPLPKCDIKKTAQVLRSMLGEPYSPHKTYMKGWITACSLLEDYTPGVPLKTNAQLGRAIPLWDHYKRGGLIEEKQKYEISEEMGQVITDLLGSYIRTEIEICMRRTQGLFAVISAYENRYHEHVRSRGRLCFSDLTLLLAGKGAMRLWEEGSRQLIDFRLDARYDHWLLDEFQDTSQPQWQAIRYLIDEVMQDTEGDRSLFVVGDSKQSIYGWRGGEPKLFDDLRDHYGKQLAEWGMDASYRSSSHVLDLVNDVCDLSGSGWSEIFPAASIDRWCYQTHIPAKKLMGHAMVIETTVAVDANSDEKTEARHAAMWQVIEKVDPIARGLTCAVLVTKNAQVTAVVDYLRRKLSGIHVASESETTLVDGPEGAVILDLFRWLQNPAHEFGEIHVELSPLKLVVQQITGTEDSNDQWRWLTNEVARRGVESLVQSLVAGLFNSCDISPYGASRLDEILTAAHDFSTRGGSIADWVKMLESRSLRESTRDGMIQVMTIHKCKGLGFDVVILPELNQAKAFTDAGQLGVLERKDNQGSTEYIIKKPNKAICDAEPKLSQMMQAWEAEQCYERFCNLYVALTRAVHASYCILDPVKENWKPSPKYADWIREATSASPETDLLLGGDSYKVLYESGAWLDVEKEKAVSHKTLDKKTLQPGVLRISRKVASGAKGYEAGTILTKGKGMRFGNVVHQLFEGVTWLDELPDLGDELSARTVADCLEAPTIRPYFQRPLGEFKLLREQPIETRINEQWVSGIIDRAVILLENSKPKSIAIIDFKTDTKITAESLREKYSDQIALYRQALSSIYSLPEKNITCHLLSTSLKEMVDV